MAEAKGSLSVPGQIDLGLISSENTPTVGIKSPKESKRRIHPYNIPKGTATWSGPYGKAGTVRLDDVPADVVAYPVYKKPLSGALTFMVEVDSPPEFQGKRYRIAKPIKGTGWYR